MTDAEKLTNLKTILGITGNDHDAELGVYLNLTAQEILQWKYSLCGGVPEDVSDVPPSEEVIQILACAQGYGQQRAPGELVHNENGINRTWKYADMAEYVHANVIAYAGLPR